MGLLEAQRNGAVQATAFLIDEADVTPAELADDPRFAESLYQLALQLDLTEYVRSAGA